MSVNISRFGSDTSDQNPVDTQDNLGSFRKMHRRKEHSIPLATFSVRYE